ncbi:hypothetical protein E2C01_055044 [Portunus trituberculatus]|uniref:Uncharacterized protein n=1 Tax=Portunus trituberculatus TaxID=210409 RepID=A0A5B7GQ64_PORTR|nr:hypothetical protein [Portunus trituberculatus]
MGGANSGGKLLQWWQWQVEEGGEVAGKGVGESEKSCVGRLSCRVAGHVTSGPKGHHSRLSEGILVIKLRLN